MIDTRTRCGGCGKLMDPIVCWCGQPMEEHTAYDNHVPVEMGCLCYVYKTVEAELNKREDSK